MFTKPARWADLALIGMTVIWGATFVVVKRALDDASPLLFVALRFSAAAAVLAILYRDHLRGAGASARAGILCGVFLFLGYAFQTVGLRLTTAAKSAFITGL